MFCLAICFAKETLKRGGVGVSHRQEIAGEGPIATDVLTNVLYRTSERGHIFVAGRRLHLGRLTGPFGNNKSSPLQMSWSMGCALHTGCRLVKSGRQLESEPARLISWLLLGQGVQTADAHKILWTPDFGKSTASSV